MKLSLEKLSLGLILAAFPFVGGCDAQSGNAAYGSAPPAPAPAVVTAPPMVSTAPAPMDASPAAAAVDQPLPPNIDPASPVASVIKLAQAGVGENVILSFVANSTATFNLDSDGIIYLHDLGISEAVTTAMIQRDQALGNVAAAQPAQPDNTTPAPTVVEQAPPTTTMVQAAPADESYTYFYDSLAPYGSWVEVAGYGRCWQPTVVIVNRNWQPYCDNGRWLYTDRGWYWASDYSWGWAAFHYGRWFRHPSRGWCWAPDSEWGPSWVSWRYSSDYCGWAPLPPMAHYRSGVGFTYRGRGVDVSFNFGLTSDCYTFVPTDRFSDHQPGRYRAPRNQETRIYNNTTVINNFVVGDNNTIINRGIGTDRIERATHETIRPINIRENNDRNPSGGRHEQFAAGGNTLIVNRPPLREHNPEVGRSLPRVGSSTPNTPGGNRNDRNANVNNGRPADERGNNPQANNPPGGNPRGRGNEPVLSPANPRPADRNNPPVVNTPSGNQPNGGNNNPRAGNIGTPPNRGNNPPPNNNTPANGNVVTQPRSNRPLPITPAGQNTPADRNPSTQNSTANQNNPPRNVVSPAPTNPRGSQVGGRQNPDRQQNPPNNSRPIVTQPTPLPRVQSPVEAAPVNNPRTIRTPDNQNPRVADTPRYNSPRIESQISPPPRPVQVQPTFPRNNNNNPAVGSPSAPSGGRSNSDTQPARGNQRQDSNPSTGGNRSNPPDKNQRGQP